MTVELVLSAVGCVLLCYTLGRYNRTLTLQRWHFVLNAPERQAIESLRQRMQVDSALARQALDAAERAREGNRVPDALTVLRVALSILEDAGADRLTRLRAMGVYSAWSGPSAAARPRPFRGPGCARPRLATASSSGTRSASGSGCSWVGCDRLRRPRSAERGRASWGRLGARSALGCPPRLSQ